MLVDNGFNNLSELLSKMMSNDPLIEKDLSLMKINKKGLRLRLLYKLEDEIAEQAGIRKKGKSKQLPDLRYWLEDTQLA